MKQARIKQDTQRDLETLGADRGALLPTKEEAQKREEEAAEEKGEKPKPPHVREFERLMKEIEVLDRIVQPGDHALIEEVFGAGAKYSRPLGEIEAAAQQDMRTPDDDG